MTRQHREQLLSRIVERNRALQPIEALLDGFTLSPLDRLNPLNNLGLARCPFRKSCASIFWARQRVKSWACSPHVVLTLLHDKDLDHARASCMPGIPGS
jgi:hypothetical protein